MSHRHLRILAVLTIMLAGSLGALQPLDPAGPASAQEAQAEGIIHLPVRWCAVEGSMAVEAPGALGESDTDSVLLKRQARANDRIWLPGAGIMLRSAFTAPMIDYASYPIIEDPITPDEGGYGELGDIFDPKEEFRKRVDGNTVEAASELSLAIASCRDAWDELETNAGETEPTSPLQGPIALNIGRFVDANDDPTALLGWGGYTTWAPKSAHPCVTPSGATTASDGYFAVVDLSVIEADPWVEAEQLDPGQVDAGLIAHELGHVLYLSHGDGEDNDDDRFYDKWCDPWELPPATAETVMHPDILEATSDLTKRQRSTSRDIATVYTGSQTHAFANSNATPTATPEGDSGNGFTLSDQRADMAGDVDERAASVDLTYVELALNASQGTVTLTHGLAGLVGPEETNAYFAFLDLNQVEGGDVATLELPSQVDDDDLRSQLDEIMLGSQPEGIDLVAMVIVDEDRTASLTVWTSSGGEFSVVPGDEINVQLTSPEGGEDLPLQSGEDGEASTPLSDVVVISLPSDVIGTIEEQDAEQSQVKVKTVAANGQQFDVLQRFEGNETSSELAILHLEPPEFPTCQVMASQAQPGETVELQVSGFGTTDIGVLISLGDQILADGSLDDEVSSFELTIPEDAEAGLRLITVRIIDTALTADCALQIGDPEPQG